MFNELLNDCDLLLAHVNSELIVEPHMGLGSSIILHAGRQTNGQTETETETETGTETETQDTDTDTDTHTHLEVREVEVPRGQGLVDLSQVSHDRRTPLREHLDGGLHDLVHVAVELREQRQLAHARVDVDERVVGEAERLEPRAASNLLREAAEVVFAEGEAPQVHELPERGGQRLKLVLVQHQLLEPDDGAHVLGHARDLVVRHGDAPERRGVEHMMYDACLYYVRSEPPSDQRGPLIRAAH